MATDNSPPKIRVILTIAFSSVVILGALNFVFRSYFQMMTEEAEHQHLRPAEALIKLREGEQKNLTTGALPIDKAIAELASKGRESEGLKDIAPQQSTDLVIDVYRVTHITGETTQWSGESVRLDRGFVGLVKTRRISPLRTTAIAVAAGTVLALTAGRALTGGGKDPKDPPDPIEPPTSTRIPIGIRIRMMTP